MSIKQYILSGFDYFFYRFTYLFRKTDGFRGDTAIFALTGMQVTLIADIVIYFMLDLSTSQRLFYRDYFVIGVFVISAILVLTNFKRYKGKYYSLKLRWKDETERQRDERFLILLGCIFFIVFFIPLLTIING